MVTVASNNLFPSILFDETTAPATPAAGTQRLFVDQADGLLKLKDDAGVVTALATGTPLVDPMTLRGDIVIRDASNVTARLGKGAAGTYLGSDGTDVAYSAVTDAKLSVSDITTNNASTTAHGFAPKYPNDATKYLDGTGAYSSPTGGSASRPLIQSASNSGTSVTSLAITLGGAPAATSLLFLTIAATAATAVSSISQTNVVWTMLRRKANGSSAVVELWKGVVSASAGTVATATLSGTLTNVVGAVVEFDATGMTGTLDQAADNSGSGTRNETGFIKPTGANAVAFVLFATSNGTIPLSPTGPFYLCLAPSFAAFGYAWTGKNGAYSCVPVQTSGTWANMVVSVI